MIWIELSWPCPCESGTPYAECCLRELSWAVGGPATRQSAVGVRGQSFEAIAPKWHTSPYSVARAAEHEIFRSGRFEPLRPVMLSDLEMLPTGLLLAELELMGIRLSETEFVAAAREHRSAWELSRRWRASIPAERPRDHDFVALAVCDLWRRWSPTRPSMEMVDDLIREGELDLLGSHMAWDSAYDAWLSAWQILRDWLGPEVRTLEAADAVFQGSVLLSHWIPDFATSWEVGLDGSRARRERNLAFLRECLERFQHEDPQTLRRIRVDLAVVHFDLGENDQARFELEALIAEEPAFCEPYSVLAGTLFYRAETPEQVEEVIGILLRAKTAGVVDGDIHDLDLRLEEAYEKLADLRHDNPERACNEAERE